MERMAARVYCTVLLCLAGCWSSTDAAPGLNRTVNPGVCPRRTIEPGMCALIKFVSCVDDSDCTNNQKCCSNGCGLQCMAPVAAKPGECPKTKAELVLCKRKDDELCADDSECPKNQKCCRTACGGTRCTAPVTVKPGVCPKINSEIRCIRKDDELCADDSECPDNQKCCGTPCGGTRCTAPVTVNPGVCPGPRYGAAECALIKFVSCADDRDCANNEKCCNNGCGLQCMTAVTDVCKLPMEVGPCKAYKPMWGFDSAAGKCVSFVYGGCEGNGNRFNTLKECEESCGVRNDVCGLPLDPGFCLAYMPMWGFDSAAGKCVSFVYGGCQGNGNRFNSQKECEESCGVRHDVCGLPLDPGPCEAHMPMWGFDSAVGKCVSFVYGGCQGNDNRFNSQKECEKSCGVRHVNPGVCPRRKYEVAMCARMTFMPCVDDGDCASNEKCCNNGCGLQCMTAVTAKPGVCPAKKYKPAMCARIKFVSCADDSDCTNNQKCCSNGCGLQCMAPVKVKPGVCPVRKSKPGMCPLMNFMSCVDDSDCVNNEKCCSNGCGLDCMPPVTGRLPY